MSTREEGAPAPDVRPGLVLGRYELLVPIAAGGMAQVWAARMRGARQFQKIVAVKTMLPKLSEDEQFEQMFLDEASLASQVRHPNAVEILDLGEQQGVLYLVMEWIEGVPLNQLMKEAKSHGGVPYAVAARIAMHACAGLHAAHELKDEKGQLVGLVHRDVSPQNLLVTYDGVTKVVDFGVAKATALGGGATVAGQIKGKVSYMAPEQVNGEGLDRRADVFALGIVLYALTTGKHPFRRESEAATMYNICSPQAVVPPSKIVHDYPRELELVLQKALEKDRNERYASCDEMLRALDALPPQLRASSDRDVATFINAVFGGTRISQKKRLEEAIVRADSSPEAGLWPGPDLQSQVTGRLPSSSVVTQELTGVPTGIHPNAARNRMLGIVGLVGLTLSGALLWLMLHGGEEAEVTAGPAAPAGAMTVTTPPLPTAEARSLSELEEEPAEKPSIATAPSIRAPSGSESGASTSDAAKPAPGAKPSSSPSTAKPGTAKPPSAKPAGAAQPAPAGSDWKYDAGF